MNDEEPADTAGGLRRLIRTLSYRKVSSLPGLSAVPTRRTPWEHEVGVTSAFSNTTPARSVMFYRHRAAVVARAALEEGEHQVRASFRTGGPGMRFHPAAPYIH